MTREALDDLMVVTLRRGEERSALNQERADAIAPRAVDVALAAGNDAA